MPSTTSAIIQSALSLPEGLFEFLDKPIPVLDDISAINDVDSATIACGILSKNINTILKTFEGLKPVQLQLRISQYHPSIIGMLCSGLERIGGGGLQVLSPRDGGSYPGWFDQWFIYAESSTIVSVTVTVTGPNPEESFDLDRTGQDFKATWPCGLGSWTAVFEGKDKDDVVAATATASFDVLSWDIWPPEGAEIETGQHTVTLDPQGMPVESVTVTYTDADGATLDLAMEIAGGIFEALIDFGVAGLSTLAFEILLPASLAAGVLYEERQLTVMPMA